MNGKRMFILLCAALLLWAGVGIRSANAREEAIPIQVLLLPKFEVGELSGDFLGEAQYYYEAYLCGGEAYDIAAGFEGGKLYVKDGVALYITGMGKVNAALSTAAVLSDPRFDFSGAYVISIGCAGSAEGYSVMGDVFLITAAVDFDLGHHADAREIRDREGTTWFHDPDFDSAAVILLDEELMERTFERIRDVPLETTERTRNYMRAAFDGAEWAVRDPKVQRGTTVTGDNYWKGMYNHQNALLMTKTYGCPDPYALTEMEDVAIGMTLKRFGMEDRFIILRDSVNMDVFMLGATPESLWAPNATATETLASDDSVEAADIFATAMKNNFVVGKVLVDAILSGELQAEAVPAAA